MEILTISIVRIVCLLLTIFAMSCAKDFKRELSSPPPIGSQEDKVPPSDSRESGDGSIGIEPTFVLPGEYTSAEGKLLNFSNEDLKPKVIFFSGETCVVCRQETEHFASEFKKKGLPENINIYTILVGSYPEDLPFWIQSIANPVEWNTGVDQELSLFNKYFNVLVTPSTLVFNPKTGIINRFQSVQTQEQLEQVTGPWYNSTHN